jgi:hypothetical protein
MSAVDLDITIEKGTTFKYSLAFMNSDSTPIPLIGYSAKMQLRLKPSTVAILAEYTTANGKITINEPAGKINIYVPATETNTYTWIDGVYDLVIISPDGEVTRLLKGAVTVSPNVTRL